MQGLNINIIKPVNTTAGVQLPVLLYIFGGGFEIGGPSKFDGRRIVERSIEIGEPIVYISLNYRVNAFSFLASEEVKAAGVSNLGLYDQREAFRWVQKYITTFGSDLKKVTVYGLSSGAISIALQMVTNGGDVEGLFRAGVMDAGSPIPVGDISHGQQYYDTLVQQTGCSNASDTLECLRQAPYDQLKAAMDQTPAITSYKILNSLNLAWMPRVDSAFLKDHPQQLVKQGSMAKIPMINGDADDEGTLFTVFNYNTTTNNETHKYIAEVYLPNATQAKVNRVLTLYSDDVADGSPFDTGDANAVTPEFKRLTAFQEDIVFQAPRQFFLQHQSSGKQDTWLFLGSEQAQQILARSQLGRPGLGELYSSVTEPLHHRFHGSEMASFWGPGNMIDYLIRFVVHLDPNSETSLPWPKYTPASPQLLTLWDGSASNITKDTFRKEQMEYLTELFMKHPL
ncbi:hypothetical protein EWM64_g4166 [Hericium alpestre]|uniref:Carboxylesterase type B domain-containing protein n=1 Tax=Hericium alpestre TaxID=135208 RepID=A0A4Y9ZZD2_9AGAM|nr:hypothetical protein EWM64_g4166 [Hericium alpestre]